MFSIKVFWCERFIVIHNLPEIIHAIPNIIQFIIIYMRPKCRKYNVCITNTNDLVLIIADIFQELIIP
jgi:hypothetical protein